MTTIQQVANLAKEYSIQLEQERISRNNFWSLLRKLRKEYTTSYNATIEEVFSFSQYVEENYGIVLKYDNAGNILGDFDITNPSRYTFCLLKHK
jgi:hypothetical protein